MTIEFYDWEDIRAELFDGDEEALAAERARTEAWVREYRRGSDASSGDSENDQSSK